jgi:hypothetical protein
MGEITGTIRQHIQHDDTDKLSGILSRWKRNGNLVRRFDAELIRKAIVDDDIPLADMVWSFGKYQGWVSRLRATRGRARSVGDRGEHSMLTMRLMKRRMDLFSSRGGPVVALEIAQEELSDAEDV